MNLGSDTLPSGTLLFADTLEVGKVLGRGGFGIVYEAFHKQYQKRLAIKELFPQELASRGQNNQVQVSSQPEMQAAIARTSREAAMLRSLKHPSATKLFAYWEENGTAYMALELLQGETLESRIEKGQLLNAEEAKQALLTILEVLEELHSHGYLHRDIKPANIMFTPTRVELIDFGSLTEFKKGERTKVTSRIATPEYAPLEQFGSEVTLSPATDLYALAATFCEAMTGSRVPSALERANGASIEPNIVAVQRVSRELSDVLEKALESRIDLRYLTAEAMRLDLTSMAENQKIIAQIPTPTNKRFNWFWILTRAATIAIALSLLGIQIIEPYSFIRSRIAYLFLPTLNDFLANETFFYTDKSDEPNFIDSFKFSTFGKDFYTTIDSAAILNKNILLVSFHVNSQKSKNSFYIINFYNINTKKRTNTFQIIFDEYMYFPQKRNKFILSNDRNSIYIYFANFIYKIDLKNNLHYKFSSNFPITDNFFVGKNYISFSTFDYNNMFSENINILNKNTFDVVFQRKYDKNTDLSYVFDEKYLIIFLYDRITWTCTKEKYLVSDFSKISSEKFKNCPYSYNKLNYSLFLNQAPYSGKPSPSTYDISRLSNDGEFEVMKNFKSLDLIKNFSIDENKIYYYKDKTIFSFDFKSKAENKVLNIECSSNFCYLSGDFVLNINQNIIKRYAVKKNP